MLWLAAALGAVAGCDAGGPARLDTAVREGPAPIPGWEVSERLPPGWDVGEITRAALAGDGTRDHPRIGGAGEGRVLLWEFRENFGATNDSEGCILWIHVREGKRRWVLATLFRHPRAVGDPPRWRLAHVYHADQVPRREFDRPPTNSDVYQFLRDSLWDFAPPESRLVNRVLRADAWKDATGQAPSLPLPLPSPSPPEGPGRVLSDDDYKRTD
jgi:hypothetical protein